MDIFFFGHSQHCVGEIPPPHIGTELWILATQRKLLTSISPHSSEIDNILFVMDLRLTANLIPSLATNEPREQRIPEVLAIVQHQAVVGVFSGHPLVNVANDGAGALWGSTHTMPRSSSCESVTDIVFCVYVWENNVCLMCSEV